MGDILPVLFAGEKGPAPVSPLFIAKQISTCYHIS